MRPHVRSYDDVEPINHSTNMQGGSLYLANNIFRLFSGDCTVTEVNNTEYFTLDNQTVAKTWYKPSWFQRELSDGSEVSPSIVGIYVGGIGSHFECNAATMRYISKTYFDGLHTMAIYGFNAESFLTVNQFIESLKHLYDKIRKKYPEVPIIGLGHSLGTGIMCRLSTERHFRALILYNPFQRPSDIVQETASWISSFTMKIMSWFMGGSLDSDTNIQKTLVDSQNVPFLLFVYVSNQDQLIPNKFGRALAETAAKRPDMKVMLYSHDGTHSEILHEHLQRQIHEVLNDSLV